MSLFASLFSTIILAAPPEPVAAQLQIGDKAPQLDKVQWIKGDPADPGSGKGVYVFEFWATWCVPCVMKMPHITELQKKFNGQGVRFVGLTSSGFRGQKLDEIKKFVAAKGDQMGYTVGFDPTDESFEKYMTAAGVNGLPYAFVVSRDGRIAWHGYPDHQLEEIVRQVAAGSFNVEKFRK